ncbi:MAG: 2OG-Fe(II) oxygenase [Leptospirales bacterium]
MSLNEKLITESKMSLQALVALCKRDIDAIRIPGYIEESVCAELSEKLFSYSDLKQYSMAPDINIKRTGMTLFETQYNNRFLQTYFGTAMSEKKSLAEQCYPNINPNELVQANLKRVWKYGAQVERIEGKQCHYGTCRAFFEGQRLPPHVDYLPKDVKDYPQALWPQCQLAANIYIKNPPKGGELNCWNDDINIENLHTIQSGVYDFIKDDILDAPVVSIKPKDGDLILIRSSDIHSVSPFSGSARAAFSFFINYRGRTKPLYFYV